MASTILVVEDNATMRRMLRVALETEGYRVSEAPDGRAALAAMDRSRHDLILQDLILPDMDGIELVRRLRARPGGTAVPILALSGFMSRLEEAKTADAGFTAMLVKPIEPSRLLDLVRLYLPEEDGRPVPGGDGHHVLLVDADPVRLRMTRLHLAQFGFQLTTAGGAVEALALARAHRPDVILSDMFMPEADGFQLCLEVRQDPRLSSVPVVLISSQDGSPDDHELSTRVGANILVTRSVDLTAVRKALLEVLESHAHPAAEPPSDRLMLKHARVVIQQLERQNAAAAGLSQRCAMQAAELSLLSGVAEALTRKADTEVALRDVLAATLDAAGISKGALILKRDDGELEVRQHIGFSDAERVGLRDFFGHLPLLEEAVRVGTSLSIPSSASPDATSAAILRAANVETLQVVPLRSDGRGMGAIVIAATRTDVTSDDSVAFARAIGNQIVQSLELARSVASLSASEQRYRTLLETASDAIAVLTTDGIIREMNHRWEEITGLPRDRMLGHDVREFAPSGKSEEGPVFRDPVDGVRPSPVTARIARADGSVAVLEFSNTTVELDGERLIFAIGRDVTGQRLLENQLHQAQKLEAIGQLAGGVAHDFNNLLTVILGFADLVAAGLRSDDPVRSDLAEVKKAGERAEGLTRQLLAFGRKQILSPRVLDINGAVADMQPMLRRLISEDVTLTVALAPGAGHVMMDPTQIEQILINLAVNAAHAMPRGGRLTIETASVTVDEQYQRRHLTVTPGRYVQLAVSDTGVGMDDSIQQHIFEPFFTTKDPGMGTGLGLATVYGIVKQSGGNIWVYSEPGRGACFKIYLPHVSPAPSRPRRSGAPTRMVRGTETILLVEDDDGVRRLTRIALERAGYRILEAEHPRAALRVAGDWTDTIHLLLSDVIMPESDGPPLYGRLLEERPALRALYMSGYADDAIVRHGVLVEGTPFLQKPFTPDILARKVREVLDAPRAT